MRGPRGISTPWARAPRAALSSKLTVVIAGVTALLSCFLATSAVLIAFAAGGAATGYQATTACPDWYGPVFSRASLPSAKAPAVIDTVRRQAAAHDFAQPVVAMYTPMMFADVGPADRRKFTVGYRDDGVGHLEQVARGAGAGLWVGDDLTRFSPVRPGDAVADGRLPPIAGVYHAMSVPPPRWWCSQQHDATVYPYANDPLNTIAFASDQRTFTDVVTAAKLPALANFTVSFYLDPPRTTQQARADLDRSRELIAAVAADLERQGLGDAVAAQSPFERSVQLAGQAQSNVLVSILPLAAISVLVGCGGIAVVALQWYQRRRAQVRLLAARGAGPVALGGLAVAELGLPVLAGGVLGIVGARLSLPWYAPPGEVALGPQWAAAAIAGGVLLVSLALLAAVAGVRAHREFQVGRLPRRSARWLAFVPWELVTAGVAVLGWTKLAGYGASSRVGTPLPQINPLALTYPVFVVLTAGLVGARVVWLLLRASHRVRLWSRPSLQLAIRRLAGARAPVTGALVLRMGMGVRALFGSHLIELGALAGLAALAGVGCGVTVAFLAVPRFDPVRWLAPTSALPDQTTFVLAVAATGVLVVLLAGWLAVRSVRTARTAELLRG